MEQWLTAEQKASVSTQIDLEHKLRAFGVNRSKWTKQLQKQ